MRKPKLRSIVLAGVITFSATTATAFNLFVSQDLPVLIEMLGVELRSVAKLGSVLVQVKEQVAQAREYTNLAKAAWGAIEDLQTMSWQDLGRAAREGLFRAFPEAEDIYADVQDIHDLDHQDYRAVATLRGMLWENIYGPAIDEIHRSEHTLDVLAGWQEQSLRLEAREQGYRKETYAWEETCATALERGAEGACVSASNRATIRSLLLLGDIQATAIDLQQTTQAAFEADERTRTNATLAFNRWIFDLTSFARVSYQTDRPCSAGRCLYDSYASKTYEYISRFRAEHRDSAHAQGDSRW